MFARAYPHYHYSRPLLSPGLPTELGCLESGVRYFLQLGHSARLLHLVQDSYFLLLALGLPVALGNGKWLLLH